MKCQHCQRELSVAESIEELESKYKELQEMVNILMDERNESIRRKNHIRSAEMAQLWHDVGNG